MKKFRPGKAYPISTLPDDLYDDSLESKDKWSLKDALFWNDCQGWWQESISDYHIAVMKNGDGGALFWSPEPDDPMTNEEVIEMRKRQRKLAA